MTTGCPERIRRENALHLPKPVHAAKNSDPSKHEKDAHNNICSQHLECSAVAAPLSIERLLTKFKKNTQILGLGEWYNGVSSHGRGHTPLPYLTAPIEL
eukprot:1148400-Pelagomonas_calceolata.AAC.2